MSLPNHLKISFVKSSSSDSTIKEIYTPQKITQKPIVDELSKIEQSQDGRMRMKTKSIQKSDSNRNNQTKKSQTNNKPL